MKAIGKNEDDPEEEVEVIQILSDTNDEITELFICKYCKYSTKDLDQLDNHIYKSHQYEQTLDTDGEKSKFSIEPSVPNQSTSVVSDEESSDTEIFVCPVCEYETSKKKVLRKHMLHHETPVDCVYKCSECNYTTRRKCDMPKHLISHCNNIDMYQCPTCPYATKRRSDLPKHMLCHKKFLDSQIYHCEYCNYSSKRKGDLRKHSLTHNGDIALEKCTECEYVSPRRSDLNKHALVHCDRNFSDVYKCYKCEFFTDKGLRFSKHILNNCAVDDLSIFDPVTNEHIVIEDSLHEFENDANLVEEETETVIVPSQHVQKKVYKPRRSRYNKYHVEEDSSTGFKYPRVNDVQNSYTTEYRKFTVKEKDTAFKKTGFRYPRVDEINRYYNTKRRRLRETEENEDLSTTNGVVVEEAEVQVEDEVERALYELGEGTAEVQAGSDDVSQIVNEEELRVNMPTRTFQSPKSLRAN